MNHNIVVFAYNQIGFDCLKFLIEQNINVSCVFTHADSKTENIYFDSVAHLAKKNNIIVFKDVDLKSEEIYNIVKEINPRLILSFYYRKLIPSKILSIPSAGAYNIHGSLLPKYRGCAPVNWAIINGETETGVSLHEMTAQADAGDIIDQVKVSIGKDETALDVLKKLWPAAVKVLERQIRHLLSGKIEKIKQNEKNASYFGRRKQSDGLIDWNWPSKKIYDYVRALTTPYPGAFAKLNGKNIIIWEAKYKILNASSSCNYLTPGDIISEAPFKIKTNDGYLEILNYEEMPSI